MCICVCIFLSRKKLLEKSRARCYRQLFSRFFQAEPSRCFANDFEITPVAMASDLRAENKRDSSNYMSLRRRSSRLFIPQERLTRSSISAVNANRYARELVRRARTRTHVLTLLRCSSVWWADINAHGSLLRPDVCVCVMCVHECMCVKSTTCVRRRHRLRVRRGW